MPIVTFTSDYGWNDPDTAVVRGHLYTEMLRMNCAAPIVDISHGILPRNHQEAGYIVGSSYSAFPKGSVHLVLVDCLDIRETKLMAMELDGHYFLGLDHGGLSLIRPDLEPTQVVQIDLKNRLELPYSEAKLAAACAHLLNQGALSLLGPTIAQMEKMQVIHPEVKNGQTAIIHVQFIDHFGQIITNARKEWLANWQGGHRFQAIVRGRKIPALLHEAQQLNDPSLLYYRLNRFGNLEIGISRPGGNRSNTAATLLGVSVHDPIELQIIA